MSELLIPTIGPNKMVPVSPIGTIQKSENDTSMRPFGCTYYLDDPRGRTNHVAIKVNNNCDFHIKKDPGDINFYFEADENNFFRSVLVGFNATGKEDAIKVSFPHIQHLTSLWCLKYKRPVSIFSVQVYDKKNKAKWLIPKVTPSVIPQIERPFVTVWNTALTSLVAVFKEGMNSITFSHKFISYYKILEAYPNQGPFKELNNYCTKNNINMPRTSKVLNKSLLKGAFDTQYHSKYVGKKYTRIRDELKLYRNSIAHPFISDSYLDLDTYEVQAELCAISNMLERIALDILEEEINALVCVSSDKVFQKAMKSYINA
jgi:hypothetical protein